MLVQRADAVRAICRARWLGLLFAIAQIAVFYPDLPADHRWVLFALLTFYAIANLVLWNVARRPVGAQRISALAVGSLSLDVVVVSAFVGLYLFDPGTPVRSLLFVLPLEGALLFQLRGAMATMSVAGVLYVAAEYLSAQLFDHPFRPVAVGFRIAIGLIIAAVAGGIASHLESHRHRVIRSERNVARINNRLTTLLSNLPGMAYRARNDEKWTLDFVSEGVADLTGYTAEEFMARPDLSFEALIHPEDSARVRAEVEAAVRERRQFQVEYRLLDRDGVEKWVWEQGRGVPDPEDGLALEGLIIDATDRRRLEGQLAQAQKMEAVGRLAGGIAHDFNNLLSVVTSYAVLVADDLPPGSPLRDDLAEIHSAGKRGADLVRQLLAFSRDQVVAPQIVDVDAVVGDMTNLLRKAVGEAIRLETSLSADGAVLIDRGQLEQILMNLVVNARDAMPDGGDLRIETRCGPVPGVPSVESAVDADSEWLTISVVDTGEGIPPDVLAHIFEPFFTTKQQGGGTGLGLATVYGIVDGCGGHIEIRSDVGEGTVVDVHLPIAPRPATSGTSHREATQDPAEGGHTILVVEDEAPVRNVLERMLTKGGHEVCTAASGREALIYLEDNDVDLVITDVMMPGLSGAGLIEEMRHRGDGAPEVIYISGYDREVVAEKTNRVGDDDVLIQKPFSADELLGAVSRKLTGPTSGS